MKGVVKGKGEAIIHMKDENNIKRRVRILNALYIPSFQQEIFSVQAATEEGARFTFEENGAELRS